MAPVSEFELFDQGRRLLETTVTLALSCPPGGDANWDAALKALWVTPLSADERARHLREGPGQSRGALLLEVRWALDAVIKPIARQMDDQYKLRTAADQAVRDYVTAVKPRVTTSSIFANAMAGIATSPGRIDGNAASVADSCRCCGAPRSDRSSNSCRYCGETI